MSRQKFAVHCCLLDRECRRYAGWVWRLYVHTPWALFGVALWPSGRFFQINGKPQWFNVAK